MWQVQTEAKRANFMTAPIQPLMDKCPTQCVIRNNFFSSESRKRIDVVHPYAGSKSAESLKLTATSLSEVNHSEPRVYLQRLNRHCRFRKAASSNSMGPSYIHLSQSVSAPIIQPWFIESTYNIGPFSRAWSHSELKAFKYHHRRQMASYVQDLGIQYKVCCHMSHSGPHCACLLPECRITSTALINMAIKSQVRGHGAQHVRFYLVSKQRSHIGVRLFSFLDITQTL